MGCWFEINGERVGNILHREGQAKILDVFARGVAKPNYFVGLDARGLSLEATAYELDYPPPIPAVSDTLASLFLEGGYLEFWPPGEPTPTGYARKPLEFTTLAHRQYGASIVSDEVSFTNALSWTPQLTEPPPGENAGWQTPEGGSIPAWDRPVGYPWYRPVHETDHPNAFDNISDVRRESWWTVASVFLCTVASGTSGTLISTARLANPYKLKPDTTLRVRVGMEISAR